MLIHSWKHPASLPVEPLGGATEHTDTDHSVKSRIRPSGRCLDRESESSTAFLVEGMQVSARAAGGAGAPRGRLAIPEAFSAEQLIYLVDGRLFQPIVELHPSPVCVCGSAMFVVQTADAVSCGFGNNLWLWFLRCVKKKTSAKTLIYSCLYFTLRLMVVCVGRFLCY